MISSLITLLIWIAILGLIVWAITTLVPMPAQFRTVIIVIASIVALLILLGVVTGAGPVPALHWR